MDENVKHNLFKLFTDKYICSLFLGDDIFFIGNEKFYCIEKGYTNERSRGQEVHSVAVLLICLHGEELNSLKLFTKKLFLGNLVQSNTTRDEN